MFDLKALAHEYMTKAKANLVKDGHLLPIVAVVAGGDDVHIIPLDFRNHEDKRLKYGVIAALAKKINAIACIAINDVYMKQMGANREEFNAALRTYRSGDLAKHPTPDRVEAIMVAIKSGVRNENSWALICPYTRLNGKFVFEPIQEQPEGHMQMIPDWKESTTV